MALSDIKRGGKKRNHLGGGRAAWQKLGCGDEEIARLCDIAMEGDRGIAKSFGGKLELGDTIANGDKTCQLRFKK